MVRPCLRNPKSNLFSLAVYSECVMLSDTNTRKWFKCVNEDSVPLHVTTPVLNNENTDP